MILRDRACRVGVAILRWAAPILRHDVVRRDFYSPVPAIPPPDDPVWTQPTPLLGIDLDSVTHLRLLETDLLGYLDEFHPPAEPRADGGFHLWNGFYQAVDAELLYALIRHLKPRRIIEIGSGYSTLVTSAACTRNRAEGHASEFTTVDPEPRIPLEASGGRPDRVVRTSVQQLSLDTLLQLDRGDVLFVDSSHAVKLGSDVNFLVLEVLPRLRPGVVVHFHDVFLPYEYPRAWYERGTYSTEHYLLHAFLIGNAAYEVLFAAHAVAREHRARLCELIPSLRSRDDHFPAAFWIVRTEAPAAPSHTAGRASSARRPRTPCHR